MYTGNKQLTILTVNMNPTLSLRIKQVAQNIGANILSKSASEIFQYKNNEKSLFVFIDCNKNFNERIRLCKTIRESLDVPIVLIADFSDVYTRIKAFEAGCDDFFSGVFNNKELSLKLLSIIRRYNCSFKEKDFNNYLNINRHTGEISIGNVFLELTKAEYRLLLLLSSRPGYVYKRDELRKELGKEEGIAIRTVDSHIKNLRSKLSLSFPGVRFIKTEYGKGYGWDYKLIHIV